MSVFVLDFKGVPVMPCTEKRARLLLARGRARVHRMIPFVIRLVDRTLESCALQPLRIKIDPGSQTTGVALVRDAQVVDAQTGEVTRAAAVVGLMALMHRGRQIGKALTARRNMRRRRRSANARLVSTTAPSPPAGSHRPCSTGLRPPCPG